MFYLFIYLIMNDLKNKISILKNEFKEDKLQRINNKYLYDVELYIILIIVK